MYDLLKAQYSKEQFLSTAQFEPSKALHVDKYVDFKLCNVTECFKFTYKEKKKTVSYGFNLKIISVARRISLSTLVA